MSYTYTVGSIENYTSHTIVTLKADDGQIMDFEPGQYVTISAQKGVLSTPARCFSIVSAPGDEFLRLSFRRSGVFTDTISKLFIGDKVKLQGPFGSFFLDKTDQPVVMFAGGIGITPFISMLRGLINSGSTRKVTLVTSNSSPETTPFFGEVISMQHQLPSLETDLFFSKPTDGFKTGRVNDETIAEITNSSPFTKYYICGPEAFGSSITKMLIDHGVNQENIISESFAQNEKTPSSSKIVRRLLIGSGVGLMSMFGAITAAEMIKPVVSHPVSSDPIVKPAITKITTINDDAAPAQTSISTTTSNPASAQTYTAPTTTTTKTSATAPTTPAPTPPPTATTVTPPVSKAS